MLFNYMHFVAPEDQRRLEKFREAVEANGSLVQTVMQVILQGNARSGKTSLINVLQGKRTNPAEPSTGVMEKPARIELTQSTVLFDGLEWTSVTNLQEEAAILVQEVSSDLDNPVVRLEEDSEGKGEVEHSKSKDPNLSATKLTTRRKQKAHTRSGLRDVIFLFEYIHQYTCPHACPHVHVHTHVPRLMQKYIICTLTDT